MAGEALIEAARRRATAAERAQVQRTKRLEPTLAKSGAVIPGAHLRAVKYINKAIANHMSGRRVREDEDIALLKKRREEILREAERRESQSV